MIGGGLHIIRPAILLAFADSREDLPHLKKERIDLDKLLTGPFTVVQKDSATNDSIEQALLSHREDLRIFHFGGHADEEKLAFLAKDGQDGSAYVKGMAADLGAHGSIELVFLNGCFTQEQVRHFHTAGIPAVIATSAPIRDDIATEFAKLFYSNFIGGNQRMSLQQAFDQAKARIEKRFSDNYPKYYTRSLFLREERYKIQFPYELYGATPHALQLSYQNLIRSSSAPIKAIPPLAHLLLNRDVPDRKFQTQVGNHLKDAQHCPIVTLVQGKEIEAPLAMSQRFREFTVTATFESLDEVLSEAQFIREEITMPIQADFEQAETAMDVLKDQLRKKLRLSISARKVRQLSLPQLLADLDSSWEVVLLQHNWYAAEWDRQHCPQLIKEYLGTFWKLGEKEKKFWQAEEQQTLPVIVLLFNMEYASPKSWLSFKRSPESQITQSFQPYGLTLNPLPSVPRKDMRRWNNEHAQEYPKLTDEIYPRDTPQPMQPILDKLIPLVRKYQQR